MMNRKTISSRFIPAITDPIIVSQFLNEDGSFIGLLLIRQRISDMDILMMNHSFLQK